MKYLIQFHHRKTEFRVSLHACPRLDSGSETFLVGWREANVCGEGNLCGMHCRRLVVGNGAYVTDLGTAQKLGKLAFWTEWEAETEAVAIPKSDRKSAADARWEHKVVNPIRATAGDSNALLMNTDPCVFGSSFKYSNCRQSNGGILRNLDVGSLIVFGSFSESASYLDTVFVVAGEGVSFNPHRLAAGVPEVSEEYRRLTLLPLQNEDRVFSFYRGATIRSPVDGMFSFAPAKLRSTADYGRRCEIDLEALNEKLSMSEDKLFNATCYRNFKNISQNASVIRAVWEELRRQVLANGFVLGVHFDWPGR